MKKSDLKVGDTIIQMTNGAGAHIPLKITDINKEGNPIIVGMGVFGCLYDTIHVHHMFVKEDGTLEEITNE